MMVAPDRIELSHPCGYQILNLARLPISPGSHKVFLIKTCQKRLPKSVYRLTNAF